MGGCRCTYRNCTVRSDGKTHLFHYPVLDKLRCHEWLTNAQRLEFLRLTVSQLKNRVVCQHHFTDDMFMNFKQDKLKHFAVPTEDGPFCNSNCELDETKMMSPIKFEYIDTENIKNIDKKKVLSKKYGDFLANCEVMEVDPELDKSLLINPSQKTRSIVVKRIDPLKHSTVQSTFNLTPTPEEYLYQSNEVVQNQNVTSSTNTNSGNNSKNSRVRIISQKKITKPHKLSSLVPVPPFHVLQKPMETKTNKENTKKSYDFHEVEVEFEKIFPGNDNLLVPLETLPGIQGNQQLEQVTCQMPNEEMKIQQKLENMTPLKGKWGSPRTSILKSSQKNISNERIAAIEEKRKFNMKLKDIIHDTLNRTDDQTQEVSDKVKLDMQNQIVMHEHEGETELSDSQKYFMNLLEKRMNKMEETLLNRIDMNSQHIKQLKKAIEPEKPKKISIYTQTKIQPKLDETAHKRSIYNEISQYLSSEAKSKIYEELFLNEHSAKRLRTREILLGT